MILFPAIDILDGRAVRLLYGKKDMVTDYGDPLDRAKTWIDSGAEYLHIVDLSGAFDGNSHINKTIEKIASLGVPVQSGGGLRTFEDVQSRLNAGATRVILGTICY
ncbi:MAG: 1-(5-phosphoribosyl)-5-((5-phosphoribosylamino)methylideneamino)imidazole-4-carboxamide isomerase, partial [Clostridia bacterium]|nr:1-(5-phosphoribosyl)-5-((5-phosphoribosylamino)methylideneamino)imidazole-4-carboxamide isomerase [Clostridia bacterium]